MSVGCKQPGCSNLCSVFVYPYCYEHIETNISKHRDNAGQPIQGVYNQFLTTHLNSMGCCSHRLQCSTYGRRPFSVAGPMVWNSLPDNLRDSDVTVDNFNIVEKVFVFFRFFSTYRRKLMCYDNAVYKLTFYLHTFLLHSC